MNCGTRPDRDYCIPDECSDLKPVFYEYDVVDGVITRGEQIPTVTGMDRLHLYALDEEKFRSSIDEVVYLSYEDWKSI